MKLGMEIPTTHMAEISRLTDFDFAIAHRLVEDVKYLAAFDAQREKGRTVILDNGFHERGAEADPQILLQAQFQIAADIVISPDRIHDVAFTKGWLPWSLGHFGTRTAAVIVGETKEERLRLLEYYKSQYVPTLCFPYRRPRLQWIAEFDAHARGWDLGNNLHFLGMQTLSEARMLATQFPKATFDTSKPIKWAYKGARLDEVLATHGAWPEYDTYLDAPAMTAEQLSIAFYNVAALRRMLA
jgi:hypothetical protein